ncbi:response regulator [Paraburkholderia tropica]|uniref:response regulator n=1 Tax=Paraburkholderia tropica TaxID=92647 RepID=UPI001CC754A3|nr:response regulator [Paraburkholderia tropica]
MSRPLELPRVLFVDDSEVMREVWSLMLSPLGFDIVLAQSGKHALHLARSRLPDVVITDMVMPEMTGIDLFNALLADSILCVVPVIFLTSGTFPDSRPRRDHWLNKDVAPGLLAGKIRSLLV